MEKKLKIVIADDTAELGQNCAKVFKAYGMDVELCQKDGQALLKKVDILLTEVFSSSRERE